MGKLTQKHPTNNPMASNVPCRRKSRNGNKWKGSKKDVYSHFVRRYLLLSVSLTLSCNFWHINNIEILASTVLLMLCLMYRMFLPLHSQTLELFTFSCLSKHLWPSLFQKADFFITCSKTLWLFSLSSLFYQCSSFYLRTGLDDDYIVRDWSLQH